MQLRENAAILKGTVLGRSNRNFGLLIKSVGAQFGWREPITRLIPGKQISQQIST